MSDSVLVLVANETYLPFAKKLFCNAVSVGNWNGDLLLITNDENIKPFKINTRDVKVKQVRAIEDSDFSWSSYNSIVLNKFNLFEEDMKQWKHIVYLDCDITIQGDINKLIGVEEFSAVPYKSYRLNDCFLNKKSSTYKKLMEKFDLDIVPLNPGVMAFPSSIIKHNTFNDIVELYNKYKYVVCGDDEIINIFFYKRWEKLKITYNYDFEHFEKQLIKSKPPRIIHYVHRKEWQNELDYGYGKPSVLQDTIYEIKSKFLYAKFIYIRLKKSMIIYNIINRLAISLLQKSHYVKRLLNELNAYNYLNRFPPGHYHSPIPDTNEIENHYASKADAIEGIDFDFKDQQNMLDDFLPFYTEIPWSFPDDTNNSVYRYKNDKSYYRYSDAIFLYLLMRKYKPSRIIEIGSGFSSAIMLDTNDLFFQDRKIQFTFIEPNPQDRLNNLITQSDKKNCKIHTKKVQDVDVTIYKELQANDILLIDSSHVSKTGSDFNYIVFNILPLLKKGVLIHFHDIFYPFEYPKDWLIKERFFWNECYFLRAFLMNNNDYKIIFFNSAAHKYNFEYLRKNMPEVLIDHEHCGGIWIQKE